jgi:hypothetical protein
VRSVGGIIVCGAVNERAGGGEGLTAVAALPGLDCDDFPGVDCQLLPLGLNWRLLYLGILSCQGVIKVDVLSGIFSATAQPCLFGTVAHALSYATRAAPSQPKLC